MVIIPTPRVIGQLMILKLVTLTLMICHSLWQLIITLVPRSSVSATVVLNPLFLVVIFQISMNMKVSYICSKTRESSGEIHTPFI